jgi:hypothetical protein
MRKILSIGLMIISFNSFSQFIAYKTEVANKSDTKKIISKNNDYYKVNIYEDNYNLTATIVISKYFGKEISLKSIENGIDYTEAPDKIMYRTKDENGFEYYIALLKLDYSKHQMIIIDYNRKKAVYITLGH